MQLISHSVIVESPKDHVWNEMVHWESWPSWDQGMERVNFDGPIDVGSIGTLKLKGGPEVLLHVSEMSEGVSYTDYFDWLGTRFVFQHDLKELAEHRASVHFAVHASGWTAWLLGALIGAKMREQLPGWMDTFKKRCEEYRIGV